LLYHHCCDDLSGPQHGWCGRYDDHHRYGLQPVLDGSFYAPGSSVASTLVTSPYVAGNTGTSLTASAVAASGATAGSYGVSVSGSSHFAGALTVSGPVITSQTALTVGTPVGSVVTLTGTGFANTDVGAFNEVGVNDLYGIISYVSATTLNFVVTSSPTAADITAAAVATPNVS